MFNLYFTFYFYGLTFGGYDFSEESSCYAVEFPVYTPYKGKSPLVDDKEHFVGLNIVNVHDRFRGVVIVGFGL